MKVVIDTNVLVSAALRDRGPERVVLFVAEHPEFEWVVSVEILREYMEVLARPRFALPRDLLRRWARLLETVTTRVESRSSSRSSFPGTRRTRSSWPAPFLRGLTF